MKRFRDYSWLIFFMKLMRAGQGRPVALAVLLGLSLLNLYSESPGVIPRPALFDKLDDMVPDTFGTARQLLFDHYQRRFPRIPASQPVTIVAIDDRTLAAVGQWPWPRNRLASLVDAIAAQKPLAIGLDIYMPEADQTSPDKVADNLPDSAAALAAGLRALPRHETTLANSLRAAPSVLGAAAVDHAAFDTSTDLRSAPILVHGVDPLNRVKRYTYVLASLPELQAAAHGQAMLNVALEQGTVRRIPLILGLGDKLVPCMPIEILRVVTGSAAVDVYADTAGMQSVGVADVQVPTQPDGDIWLHFASIRSMQHRYVSARDVLQGQVDPERFHNKLVLVGLTGTGNTDMRTTALGELVPGIEIQAQIIETIFDGRFLRRPVWLKWAETIFVLAFGILIIWYLPHTDSRLAAFVRAVPKASAVLGLLLNLLLLASCLLLFKYVGLLVDAASIFIILSAVMGCFFSTALLDLGVQTRREAKRRRASASRSADQLPR
ncbi:putative Chase2 sensor protein [Paraburkholderia hospita]|jgi:adenylate cyclase|uniref:CHASE2 domain-containing protein n=2 Tax=Paraburkholderia hospita TaxID=169430 RepID=A0AAN1JE90_9BURK|nr:CHASE2 domain-containing protein [Paraburkholderia hospita]SKC88663.1 sensor domain CHASE2-containing protein [Burkholderia sp. CF099]EIN00566.1 putative Chase2 sensor protein [Paraburkholderia hospita]OUL75749.1 CHASE2 domain-containing protein [Paraburkholderia hospita]OUL95023.1 CHASE2 domain-containing protein [Paraburkholderia hospita]